MSEVTIAVRGLVRDAVRLTDGAEREAAERVDRLFDQPFRIAIAGMVKAGKSTLLNALVGQRVAPTDAGECTKIVTWYRQGRTYSVTGIGHDGSPRRLRFDRGADVTVHLEGLGADDLARIDVEWPSDRLAGRQLIDTPGLGSLSTDVSARSEQFLTDDQELPVDAIVYLMRHRHPADLRFLESFHGDSVAEGPMGSIAVLSRADEIGGGRADALTVAAGVAESMGSDPRIRRLSQAVIPVAGLLAETASTLRQSEFTALRDLAGLDEDEIVSSLLSVDRFRSSEALPFDVGTREALLERFGIYGIRLGARMIAKEGVTTPDAMAAGLSARSGITDLQSSLANRFDRRRDLLRCRTAIGVLQRLHGPMNDPDFTRDLERILAGAHELVELAVLDRMRQQEPDGMRPDDLADIALLFGIDGPRPATRLGLPKGTSSSDIRAAATRELERWQRRAEHPMSTPDVAHLSRLAVRTCEQILVPGSLEAGS